MLTLDIMKIVICRVKYALYYPPKKAEVFALKRQWMTKNSKYWINTPEKGKKK